MAFYIRSKQDGRFIGEFLGLGFFESDKGKDVSSEEEPIKFFSMEEAQSYLSSWSSGPGDCRVVEEEE